MKNELVSCVNDFYQFEVNIMDSVNMILNGLQEMGLSCLEAIEYMVMLVGLRLPNFGKHIHYVFYINIRYCFIEKSYTKKCTLD